jgi:hypothetical protein
MKNLDDGGCVGLSNIQLYYNKQNSEYTQSGRFWKCRLFSYFHETMSNMHRLKPDVDIVLDLLKAVLEAQPMSSFTQSLLHQYQERGGLSKKQLQGLYNKAAKITTIPSNKLATLEAIIMKKPNRYKSALPDSEPLFTKDENIGLLLQSILAKYPQHKRVLFFKSKYDNNEVLSATEIAELQKFSKLLQ